jgi:hypothetical protein
VIARSLDLSAARAADAALAWQQPDGSWRGRNLGGPMYLAATVALLAAIRALEPEEAARARVTLLRERLPDGGMAPWPGAVRSTAESALLRLAGLVACGVEGEPREAASRCLDALGGVGAAGPLAPTVAALCGAIPGTALPRVPSALALVPGHDALVGRLLGVNALIPARTLPFLGDAARAGVLPLGRSELRMRGRVAERVAAYVRERLQPSGGLAGVPIYTLFGLACLVAVGAPADDPALLRGLAYVRRVMRPVGAGLLVEPFESTHWDTAHMVRALARIGTERHLEAARRGAAYLAAAQSQEAAPADWQTPPRGAPAGGGWSWQPGNERNPDFDTSAEVLSALAEVARACPSSRASLAEVIALGARWLRAFQNPDGGWAAFSWGKPTPPPGALHLGRGGPWTRLRSWLAENGDPSTADITGRVLWALGAAAELGSRDPAVAAARRFLDLHRAPSGAWWGRWAVNYLAGTAYVVSGLVRAGVPPTDPTVARAVAWTLERQNEDGGWGETVDSYADPELAGRGPSTLALTGLVAWALQVAGRGEDPAVERALAFLVERQAADGAFVEETPFGTMFPLRAYWVNDGYPTFFALEALLARRG